MVIIIFLGKNNRKEFEEYSKKLRYNGYQKFIDKSYFGVMLGHHKDDVIENIFTNLMYGRNILDLTVIKEVSIKNDIKFLRPMINYPKVKYINLHINLEYHILKILHLNGLNEVK